MPTDRKIRQVAELKDRLARCTIAIATTATGLSANDMNDLRKNLRSKNVEFRVVKNTLTYLAADEAELSELKGIVQGPTALAFGYADPVEVASALHAYIQAKRSPLIIQGGVLEHRVLSTDEITTLASLPSREVLIGRLLGQMQSPISRLMRQLQSPITGLVTVLPGPLAGLTNVLRQRAAQLRV
ncbi:50S ribosomal protein L10 [SAR202 cluster bacterium AD-804-J14_MRT_500m]|nr:50S ribosomal protein L10 [SAR202 cluster bacterium AD-804-J14_MRT_500m]